MTSTALNPNLWAAGSSPKPMIEKDSDPFSSGASRLDPAAAEVLLSEGMACYAQDPVRGDFLIHFACVQSPTTLALLRIAYKFYNRQRRFDLARDLAGRALAEAARQAGMQTDFHGWSRAAWDGHDPLLFSQALLALKALAFLALRDGMEAAARPYLDTLLRLDPEDGSGASVVEALMHSAT